MKRVVTTRDIQRTTFIESLYNNLKKQAAKAEVEHEKFRVLVSSYLTDGLEEAECVELLMIDGLSRDTAESYTAMAMSLGTGKESDDSSEGLYEYSFQFEDVHGIVYSSFDIGKTVKASSNNEAWTKAEDALSIEDTLEFDKILSVNRIG
jgi:hypothetical protein